MTIHDLLLRRFATKQFDSTKSVSEADLDYVLEAARLSASSFNIQPWRILVIKDNAIRAELRKASFGQPQITDASVLLVMCAVSDLKGRMEKVATIIEQKAGTESAATYRNMVSGVLQQDSAKTESWAQRQLYIALQAMMLAAAEKGLDTCPMEGFDPAAYAQILGISDAIPTVVLPIGYAVAPGYDKVRLPMEDIVVLAQE